MTRGEKRLVVFGAGGHGRVVADVARACGWSVLGFADMNPEALGQVVDARGAKVVWTQEEALELLAVEELFGVVAIGHNEVRLGLMAKMGERVASAMVHPSVVASFGVEFGQGSVVMPRVVVNPSAVVGRGVILNTASVVEHDCVVADGVHLSPGAVLCGGVTVEQGAWVGAGSTVIPGVTVGKGAVVGAGSTVIRDVPQGVTVVGCPARVI